MRHGDVGQHHRAEQDDPGARVREPALRLLAQRVVVGFGEDVARGRLQLRLAPEDEVEELAAVAFELPAVVAPAVLAAEAERERHQVDRREVAVDGVAVDEQAVEALEEEFARDVRAEDFRLQEVRDPEPLPLPLRVQEDFVGERDHYVLGLLVELGPVSPAIEPRLRLLPLEEGDQALPDEGADLDLVRGREFVSGLRGRSRLLPVAAVPTVRRRVPRRARARGRRDPGGGARAALLPDLRDRNHVGEVDPGARLRLQVFRLALRARRRADPRAGQHHAPEAYDLPVELAERSEEECVAVFPHASPHLTIAFALRKPDREGGRTERGRRDAER